MNIKFIYKIQNITAASWWSPILTSSSTWVYVWTGASSTSKYLIWINEWLSNCQNTKQKICHSFGSFVVLNNLNNLIRVLPILTWIAKFVVRVFALTFREGFLSARALTKYKLYCTIHKILDGFDINKEEIGYEWWKVLQNDVFVWCISIYTFNYIFLVN